jgi:phospholipase C
VQKHLGPRDTNTPETDDLLSGFDPARLAGTRPLLPASYAMIDPAIVAALPHYQGKGCAAIGITPVDAAMGVQAKPPSTYNPLPSTLPKYN